MKFVKKSDCTIKQGYAIANDEVIGLPFAVVNNLRTLSVYVQAAAYNMKNEPKANPIPEPFKPKLRYADWHGMKIEPETPAIDKAVEQAVAIANDIKAKCNADKINRYLEMFQDLVQFIDNDEFIPEVHNPCQLPIPEDWNIFEWTVEDLLDNLEKVTTYGDQPFNEKVTDMAGCSVCHELDADCN